MTFICSNHKISASFHPGACPDSSMDESKFEIFVRRKQRFVQYNRSRLELSLDVMPKDARTILHIIPILLHYNDVRLPGYSSEDMPCGIDLYTPEEEGRQWLIRSLGTADLKEPPKREILALYAMGSTASIGQGPHSDFDIWVCVSSNLEERRTRLLSAKCRFLASYAKVYGVEVNLFITRENRFTVGYHDSLDEENCGSAQNLFLLDEFYRSAVHICGRYILWFFISRQEELTDYEAAARNLIDSGVFAPGEWFDFGPVADSSPAEYFGSGLWLLYKGIDAPFKAVLKILLMEAYSYEYPRCDLLSLELKDLIESKSGYSLETDAYYLMYQKISMYLTKIHDEKRLKLVRLCFYLKIYAGLEDLRSSPIMDHRKALLSKLAASWGWDARAIKNVEGKDRWKIDYVRTLYTELFASLVKSYQALLSFSVRHGIEYAITSDDAGILSRKLYAAFDEHPGKIQLFNRALASYLEEKDLTFIYPSKNSLCRKGWHVYNCAVSDPDLLNSKVIYVGESLSEAVTWASFNHILSGRTRCYVAGDGGAVTASKIKALHEDIVRLLLKDREKPSDESLQRPRENHRTLVVLNLEQDVTEQRYVRAIDVNVGSSLSCGRQRMCLIGSISLVMVNSWSEVRVLTLPEGEAGIVQLLATLLRLSKQVTAEDIERILKNIRVCCYAKHHKELLRFDVEAVIQQVFYCEVNKTRHVFAVGNNLYAAEYTGDRGVKIVQHNIFNRPEGALNIQSRYGMRPEFSMQVPPLVDRYANIGIRQYFFAPLADGWDIYIVNERNEVEIYPHYVGSRAALVNAINRFYTKHNEQERRSTQHFNLPQYFVLSSDLTSIHPFTIKGEPLSD